MSKALDYQLDLTFHALAHSVRRALFERIQKEELSVIELAKPFKSSLVAISKHLKVLEKAGLILRRKDGRMYYFQAIAKPINNAEQWIATHKKFWNFQLEVLDDYLKS